MKLKDLEVGTVIEFTDQIDDFGAYAEKGIRARVYTVEQRDSETLFLGFSYGEFSAHNSTAESPAYGTTGSLRTASQAGVVPQTEGLHFSLDQDADAFVRIISVEPKPKRSTP